MLIVLYADFIENFFLRINHLILFFVFDYVKDGKNPFESNKNFLNLMVNKKIISILKLIKTINKGNKFLNFNIFNRF